MKPIEEAAALDADFAGDESTSVIGADLLSSLTERSRRIDVGAPAVPEPEISIDVEEPAPTPLIADGEFPVIGDEESTMAMEEPEPTTVAIRSRADKPRPLPEPTPPQPLPATAPPEPQWTASLAPRVLETIRVAPLPTPDLAATANREETPAAGPRRLGRIAAAALGAAAMLLGLGHHQPLPASAISSAAVPATGAVVERWDLPTRVAATVGGLRASLAALLQPRALRLEPCTSNSGAPPRKHSRGSSGGSAAARASSRATG